MVTVQYQGVTENQPADVTTLLKDIYTQYGRTLLSSVCVGLILRLTKYYTDLSNLLPYWTVTILCFRCHVNSGSDPPENLIWAGFNMLVNPKRIQSGV